MNAGGQLRSHVTADVGADSERPALGTDLPRSVRGGRTENETGGTGERGNGHSKQDRDSLKSKTPIPPREPSCFRNRDPADERSSRGKRPRSQAPTRSPFQPSESHVCPQPPVRAGGDSPSSACPVRPPRPPSPAHASGIGHRHACPRRLSPTE